MAHNYSQLTEQAYLLRHGDVFDGTGAPVIRESVLLESGVVRAKGEQAEQLAKSLESIEIIDATDCTVMPGLIDSHCHITFDQPESNDELFFHRREGLAAIVASVNAQKVLRAGVTSFFDADCIFNVGLDLRDAIEAGVVEGPRMATGGNVLITSVGGTAGRLLPDSGRRGYAVIVSTADEIVREVRQQIKSGTDWIKVHVSGLPMRGKARGEIQAWSLDELKLVCDTAHGMGVPVVGHCRNASSTRDAAIAGFDMILHATNMDDEALAAIIEAKTPIVPTLTFQANLVDFGHRVGADPALQQVFRDEISNSAVTLKQAYDEGVPFLCGSESGFSLTPYGEWHHREMQIFVEHLGMSPLEALHCATGAGARALQKEGEIGCLLEGYQADVMIVQGKVTDDLGMLGDKRNIVKLFKAGREIDLHSPLPSQWNISGWRLSKFSDQALTQALAYQDS